MKKTFACPKCGATLDLPPAGVSSIRCGYCQTEIAAESFRAPHDVAAEAIRRTVEGTLEAQAARSRALFLALAAAAFVLLLVILGAVLGRSSSEEVAAPSPPEQAVVPPAPAPAPAPAETAEPAVAPEPPKPTPRVRFGGEGTGEGRFSHVKELAVDPNGTVYVADRTNRIQAFDATGRLLRTLTVSTTRRPTGPLDEDITEVEGLAATRDGKLWVAIGYDLQRIDATTGRVEHTTRGRNGQTCFRDIAISPRGELHVRSACTNTNRYALVHLDANGRELHRFQDPPDYDRACSGRVGVDGAGRWYVPYGTQSEVVVLEPDGRVFTRFGRRGAGPGEFESFAIDHVSLDGAGRIYVRESGDLHVFAPDGRFLARFDPSELGGMRSFALGADGTIWVMTGDGLVGAFDPLAP